MSDPTQSLPSDAAGGPVTPSAATPDRSTSPGGSGGPSRDLASGLVLIAGALAGVVVMLLHPTAHELMPSTEHPAGLVQLNVMVHGLALFAMPMIFFGLIGFARRLGPSTLNTAALVAYGYGTMAVMGAAVASGFVVPGVIDHIKAAAGSKVPDAFLLYTGLWNQGFARVYVVATAAGILLWSAAILRSARVPGAVGAVGLVISILILLGVLIGLQLDVHGFGLIMILQAAWLVTIGVTLCRSSNVVRAGPMLPRA